MEPDQSGQTPSPSDLWNRVIAEPPYDLDSRTERWHALLVEHGHPVPRQPVDPPRPAHHRPWDGS